MSARSGEFRRDLALPSVSDTERYRVFRLAKFIAAFADGKIPGVGIKHTPAKGDNWKAISMNHQHLVMSAITRLEPTIQVVEGFTLQPRSPQTRVNLGPHLDGLGRKYHQKKAYGLTATWLLHSSIGPAANVRLTSSRSGSYCDGEIPPIGDAKLTYEELEERGYDSDDDGFLVYDRRMYRDQPDYRKLLDKSIDPVISEPEVYHFEQRPLSSVLLALGTGVGPRTIHDFESVVPGQQRQVVLNYMSIMAH